MAYSSPQQRKTVVSSSAYQSFYKEQGDTSRERFELFTLQFLDDEHSFYRFINEENLDLVIVAKSLIYTFKSLEAKFEEVDFIRFPACAPGYLREITYNEINLKWRGELELDRAEKREKERQIRRQQLSKEIRIRTDLLELERFTREVCTPGYTPLFTPFRVR